LLSWENNLCQQYKPITQTTVLSLFRFSCVSQRALVGLHGKWNPDIAEAVLTHTRNQTKATITKQWRQLLPTIIQHFS